MNRKGFAVIFIVGIVAAVVVGGGVVADVVLKQNFGIGLIDAVKAIFDSGSTLQSADSLDDVRELIGVEAYDSLLAEKSTVNELLGSADLTAVNNNTEVTSILRAAFGEEYRIFLFSVANIGNLSFKVVEWSIQLNNGSITGFSDGMNYESYNVYVQADQEVISKLISGQLNPEEAVVWVNEGKLKLNPITELMKVVNALPQIVSIVQSRME